jgi:hypothetical protein
MREITQDLIEHFIHMLAYMDWGQAAVGDCFVPPLSSLDEFLTLRRSS